MSQVETGLGLRAARRSLGLSVARASALAAISPSTIKRWERGAVQPRNREAVHYLDAIGAPRISLPAVADEHGGHLTQLMLRAKRRRASSTLQDLSLLTGASVATLHRYETGERAPDPVALESIARAYGCNEDEVRLLRERPAAGDASIVNGFVEPGSSPHYWLYRSLEDCVCSDRSVGADALSDLIHGFVIMGDHRALLESWDLIAPTIRASGMRDEDLRGMRISIALARLTVRGDRKQAKALIAKCGSCEVGLHPVSVSHLARLATMCGEFDEAERLLDSLTFRAGKTGEAGMIFVADIGRVMLEFARSPSPKMLDALDRLRSRAQGPLQAYTLDVAALCFLEKLGELSLLGPVLEECSHAEREFGFGSPSARRIRNSLTLADA